MARSHNIPVQLAFIMIESGLDHVSSGGGGVEFIWAE
jgi:hypothetical protein